MPTYVALISFTDQGVRNIKDTVSRAQTAKALAKKMGGELKGLYWTQGGYDLVSISEFPDDITGMAFLGAIGSQGNLRTTTMRALTEEEMTQAIGKMG